MVTVGASNRPVKCRICGDELSAGQRKARLAPDPEQNERTFFYFHVDCLGAEVAKAHRLLGSL